MTGHCKVHTHAKSNVVHICGASFDVPQFDVKAFQSRQKVLMIMTLFITLFALSQECPSTTRGQNGKQMENYHGMQQQ